MDIALTARLRQPRSEGLRLFENWLLCWILLPNLAYGLLWIMGGPPRALPILITGLLGLAAHRAWFGLKFAIFVAAVTVSAMHFISTLFTLSIVSLLHSLRFAAELNPSAAPEYIVSAAALAGTLVAAWWLLRRPTRLVELKWKLLAFAAILITISLDTSMASTTRGSYHRIPASDALFTSAVQRSGLQDLATGDRHVLLVMVEAMGQPVDPALRSRLVNLWATPEVRARYEVITGDTLFYGSTTKGEMRELCGRWADYDQVLKQRDETCLPSVLARRGYHSSAWHSFTGGFFDRTTWYPNVGFQEMRFAPEMMEAGAEKCPGVFAGACDRDIPRQIGAALRAAEQPQFLYWLTVNSHLPVPSSERLHTEHCARFDSSLDRDFPQVCRLLQLFEQSGRELAQEIARADFPDTDILIVGDHLPPFFDRQHRSQFEQDRVPWILLRPKARLPERLAEVSASQPVS